MSFALDFVQLRETVFFLRVPEEGITAQFILGCRELELFHKANTFFREKLYSSFEFAFLYFRSRDHKIKKVD